MIADVRRSINQRRAELLARNLKPTKLFIDESTYCRIRRDAQESLCATMSHGNMYEWFEGLRIYRVQCYDYTVEVV